MTRYPSVFEADLPTLEYHDLSDPDLAHAQIAEARRHSPIGLGPYGPEVLRYEAVHAVLRDHRFRTPRGLGLDNQGITDGRLWDRATSSILSLDGEVHSRLRRLVCKAFSPRSVTRLQTLVRHTAEDLVGGLAATGSGDVVGRVSRQYPIPIICALLGAPAQDWPLFSDWADSIMKIFDWNVINDEPEIEQAWEGLDRYIEEMITERNGALTDDLLSDLIRAEDAGDRLSHSELLMLAGALLAAGTDTTRNQLAAAVHCLADHPDQFALLVAAPERVSLAVEELIRYYPVVFGTLRWATEDVELAGMTIPAGTLVLVNTAAANRDPAVFADPDRLDITRDGAPPMLTFGGGVHYCLGAHLARLELTEGLRAFATRCPVLRRTGPAPWKKLTGVTGPVSVPVSVAA